jgi:hypothetical protein
MTPPSNTPATRASTELIGAGTAQATRKNSSTPFPPVATLRPIGRQAMGYGATNVSGSGPIRSPASRRPIAAMSSSLSSKSKSSMFSRIRAGVTDLGHLATLTP